MRYQRTNDRSKNQQPPTGDESLGEDSELVKQQLITNNEFYLYTEINTESVFVLNKSLVELEKNSLRLQINFDLKSPPPIKLYINSPGGEIYAALSAVDRIKKCRVPVHTYVEGCAASAATLISIAGKQRFIREHAFLLIHQLRSWFGGTHEELKAEGINLEKLSAVLEGIYIENSKLTTETLPALLKDEVMFGPEECVKYGLVDKII
jgi:ATP-dependent protease ClpP protease subunit